jgi:hypothetical protein
LDALQIPFNKRVSNYMTMVQFSNLSSIPFQSVGQHRVCTRQEQKPRRGH